MFKDAGMSRFEACACSPAIWCEQCPGNPGVLSVNTGPLMEVVGDSLCENHETLLAGASSYGVEKRVADVLTATFDRFINPLS